MINKCLYLHHFSFKHLYFYIFLSREPGLLMSQHRTSLTQINFSSNVDSVLQPDEKLYDPVEDANIRQYANDKFIEKY